MSQGNVIPSSSDIEFSGLAFQKFHHQLNLGQQRPICMTSLSLIQQSMVMRLQTHFMDNESKTWICQIIVQRKHGKNFLESKTADPTHAGERT
jgi:hypothetical protein